LYVFNKIDTLDSRGIIENLKARFQDSVFISALHREGLNELKDKILDCYSRRIN